MGTRPLKGSCINDQFLMERFWVVGYWGSILDKLNCCHLWLHVTAMADITNCFGKKWMTPYLMGHRDITIPTCFRWPNQGRPPKQWWTLWQEAIWRAMPTMSLKLTYPLGEWTDDPSEWKWFWSPVDKHLAEKTQSAWRLWTPNQHQWGNQAKYRVLDTCLQKLPTHYQQAVLEKAILYIFEEQEQLRNPTPFGEILSAQSRPVLMWNGHS